MSDWKQKEYEKGTPVYVFVCGKKVEKRENGIMLTAYNIDIEDNPMPRIKLKSGKIVKGCDCWWIPKQEVDMDEKDSVEWKSPMKGNNNGKV